MAINILIVDDDKPMLESLVKTLRGADRNNVIGKCIVDDSFSENDNIENYDPMKHGVNFDIVLVDYQLNCSFTGMLAAAWIAIQLKIPKMTLTGGKYCGPESYFDGFIEKDEINDSPEDVIERIERVVMNFNAQKWLEKQHDNLVQEYHELLDEKEKVKNAFYKSNELKALERLLDKFDKIIDEKQSEHIKEHMILIDNEEEFRKQEKEYLDRIAIRESKIDEYIKKLEEYNE